MTADIFVARSTTYPGFACAISASLRALKLGLGDPPFNYILHSAPLREAKSKHYHWHMETTPALTKVAGFEVGTGFYINPVPPENAAKALREALALCESPSVPNVAKAS
jgi:UDPglucose--hexose-1-phosphate uridylyltransferase